MEKRIKSNETDLEMRLRDATKVERERANKERDEN